MASDPSRPPPVEGLLHLLETIANSDNADIAGRTQSFKNRFSRHTERGAALTIASHLDRQLEDALSAAMIDSSLRRKIFKEGAPLSNFATKQELLYLLGIITKNVYKELVTIRMIRNHFAHSRGHVDFSDEYVIGECKKLIYPNAIIEIIKGNHSTAPFFGVFESFDLSQDSFRFTASCLTISLFLDVAIMKLRPAFSPGG